MRHFLFLILCLVASLGALASAAAEGLHVVVTLPPLKGIVEPLLPAGSTVTVLMPPGRSEHNYEFTPADMANVGGADLLFFVGLGLEPQIEKFAAASTGRRINQSVAEAAGVSAGPGETEHEHEHDEHAAADGDEHEKECKHGVDPHVWLDPVLVRDALPALADSVRRAMEAAGIWNAGAKERLEQALAAETRKIDELNEEFVVGLKPFAGEKIVTHHAAFGRLAARYGLVIAEVIRVNEGEEPTPGRIAAIVKAVREEKVHVIFVEPQFSASMAERVAAAAGVKVGKLDPLGDGDWFSLMRSNLAALIAGMKK
ncbi:MAG: metal ABC transporter substrate-binding protein [Phycisphaerales bacterium]|nr:zinc ABC transporter substrate-binding protein [Planctomycetota bacterium]